MASTIETYLLALTSTMGQGIQAVPTTSSGTGPSTTGTEILDTTLGTYQFNATAGRRYQAVVNGLIGSTTAIGLVRTTIRDSGSSSTPTNTSTLIATSQWYGSATGGGGQSSIVLSNSFIPAASGTHTLGVFALVLTGGGTFQCIGTREFYVVDLGVF